ncbi:MAG: M48 family metallopeptidase [Candidatus Wildermuthbacteria bacterium]|nr:M48 family metallopeptidase [Candidatus Wildermuthbacteria bacterium]
MRRMIYEIPYTLRLSKRARKARIAVYPDGNVVITFPRWGKEFFAERFLQENAQWVLRKLSYFHDLRKTAPPLRTDASVQNRAKAHNFALSKVEYFNKFYGYAYNKISIKNQKTRWGSCSQKGNLNFNYKILFLPETAAEYIIVHELCHLKEFNHSSRFWKLVATAFPNYREIRKELHKRGLELL